MMLRRLHCHEAGPLLNPLVADTALVLYIQKTNAVNQITQINHKLIQTVNWATGSLGLHFTAKIVRATVNIVLTYTVTVLGNS